MSFGGGAIRAFTRERLTRESVNVWLPAGYGTLRLDWARTWSMSADYRRSVGALQGISGDAFTTDAGLVRVGGFVARPLELTLSAGYADRASEYRRRPAAYDTYTSTAQLRLHVVDEVVGAGQLRPLSVRRPQYRSHPSPAPDECSAQRGAGGSGDEPADRRRA